MERYNGEYSILASISFLMFILNAISTYVIFVDEYFFCDIWWIVWWLVYAGIGGVTARVVILIHRASCARVNFMDMAMWYLAGFIEMAKEKNLLGAIDYEKVYDVLSLNPVIKHKNISNKIKAQWGYTVKRNQKRVIDSKRSMWQRMKEK